MDEYELDERSCTKCGTSPTHSRSCNEPFCEDGWIDEYEDDAINFKPGESFLRCEECNGTGIEWWCPICGANLTIDRVKADELGLPGSMDKS